MEVLVGEIVHGKGLGRTVGMPTANLQVMRGKLPEEGVYATRVKIAGKTWDSITNIGRRPSVDDEKTITVEIFIFDFEQDIYGEIVELEIYKFLRGVKKFKDLQAVKEQVKKDLIEASEYFKMI